MAEPTPTPDQAACADPDITLAFCGPAPTNCEHDLRGPFRAFTDGNGGEATCSKCGRGAFNIWEVW